MSDAASNSKTGNLRAAEAGSRTNPNAPAQDRTRFANRTISSGPFPWLIGVGTCLLWLLAPAAASAQLTMSGDTEIKYAEGSDMVVETYTATDPDDASATIAWSLSDIGEDEDYFEIDEDSGDLTFKNVPDYDTKSTYKVRVKASSGSKTGTRDVTVTINRPPVWSVETSSTVADDGTVQVDFAENGTGNAVALTLTDPDGDFLAVGAKQANDFEKFAITHGPSGVFLTFTDGTPPDYENPTDADQDNVYEITVQAFNLDVVGASWVELPVAVTVTNVNEVPVAADDTADTDEDTSVVISVLDNDSDVDAGTTLSVSAVGTSIAPADGSVALTAGATTTVTYTPNENFHGTDTFSYTVSDGADPPGTATATVTVTVAAVEDAPVASDVTATTVQNAPVVINVLDHTWDVDTETALTAVDEVGTPNRGTVTHDGSTVTYTPNFNYIGRDLFSYTASDANGTATGWVDVTIVEAVRNANLSGLTISSGTLAPAFDKAITSYTVDVGANVGNVRVTPTVEDDGATVTVNGTAVSSGSASGSVATDPEGAVTITITVTADDKTTTNRYVVTVLRPVANAPLLFLRQPSGAADSYTWVDREQEADYTRCLGSYGEGLCPDDEYYFRYTASASSNQVRARFTSNSEYPSAAYSVETVNNADSSNKTSAASTGALAGGWTDSITLTEGKVTNVWTTFHTSGGGAMHTVTEVTTCYVAGLNLADLTVQAGTTAVTLQRDDGSNDTGFADDVSSYTASVDNAVRSVTVTPTLPANGCPTVTVNGTAVAGGSASGAIRLQADADTSIPVVFINGPSSETYTIDVYREPRESLRFDTPVADQVHSEDTQISAVQLPEANGGTPPIEYELEPALPDGLTLNEDTQTITGTPAETLPPQLYKWTATDKDGSKVGVGFWVRMTAASTGTARRDRLSSFGNKNMADQVYTVNEEIEPLALPEASGGNGPLRYTLTPTLPAGLTLDDDTRTISGTPTAAQERTKYTWTATDTDGDTASVRFSITVNPDLVPSFGDESVADQAYMVNEAIEPLALPEALGGNEPLVYELTPALPAGLAMDPATRTISGTPAEVQERTDYTWTAMDADGDAASLTFSMTVQMRAPTVVGSLPALVLYAGGASQRVEAGEAIVGSELSWAFESSDTGVASVEPDGSAVVVAPVREGAAQVTATATNAGGSASVTFDVTVRTSAAEAAAIRAALAGQARVVLGSVTEVISARIDGRARGSSLGGETRHVVNDGGVDRYDSSLGGRLGDRSLTSLADGGVWSAGVDAGSLREGGVDEALSSLVWGRSFSLALGDQASDDAAADTGRRWHLWGAADLQRAGGAADHSDFDGEWRFLYLGLDREFNERWLGGVSLSHVWGEADYTFADDTASGAGRLSSTLTGVYPYLQGRFAAGLRLWAIGGLGFGNVANVRAHAGGWRDAGDLDLRLASVGLRQPLSRIGAVGLALTSDAGLASLSATGDGSLDGAQASVRRLRLGLEMAARSAGGVEPFVHVHGRYDGGDGSGGAAAEMVLGVRYAGERLRLEIRGNYLASAADVEQWGANAQLGYGPRADGRGLSGSLTTRWGTPESGGALLDRHGLQAPGSAFASSWGRSASAQVSGEIGYGVAVPPLPGSLTPNMGYDHRDDGVARARVGVAYQPYGGAASDVRLRLDLARSERREAVAEHSIELSAVLRF